MNIMLFNFCLMIFWGGLALFLLVIGPLFMPDQVPDKGRGSMIGVGTAVLAVWNLVRWWSMRSERRLRAREAAAYQERRNPKPASNEPKPVVLPEFQFDEAPKPPGTN